MGLGTRGSGESQPALCDGLYQQWSWAKALEAPTPGQREEQDEAAGVSARCLPVIGVASGIYVWCGHLPAGSRFSTLLPAGPGYGAAAASPLYAVRSSVIDLLLTEWSIITNIGWSL